jgi:hypothetical protein
MGRCLPCVSGWCWTRWCWHWRLLSRAWNCGGGARGPGLQRGACFQARARPHGALPGNRLVQETRCGGEASTVETRRSHHSCACLLDAGPVGSRYREKSSPRGHADEREAGHGSCGPWCRRARAMIEEMASQCWCSMSYDKWIGQDVQPS